MNLKKDFDKWIAVKKRLDVTIGNVFFKEREVWWCSVGCNVGEEVEGKSSLFSRPVLILKKLTRYSFVGLPTTTANKNGTWYVPITLGGVVSRVMINQIRVFSTRRLSSKFGELDDIDWKKVKQQFGKFYI